MRVQKVMKLVGMIALMTIVTVRQMKAKIIMAMAVVICARVGIGRRESVEMRTRGKVERYERENGLEFRVIREARR